MQKTTKLLLTKIFVLLTVIFCVFALALGAIGCANEEAKVITDVKVNGTTIVVTYSDKTTENLTIEQAKVCGHKTDKDLLMTESPAFPIYAEGEEINADVCRVSIYMCVECDDLYAQYKGHELVDDDPCYTGKVCKFEACDYKTEGIDDHEFIKFELVQEGGVNKCTDVWFSGKEVCEDCGLTHLVVEEPTGHEYDNIRVGTYATETTAATLIADCKNCDDEGFTIKTLWKLGTAEADENYVKAIGDTNNTGHEASYTYDYEGNTYTVTKEDFVEDHNLVINDYTAEKYPEVIIMTGETVTCNDYANAVYTCEECKKGVNIEVKKAHVLAEEYKSTTATCTAGGVETYECTVCKEDVPVTVGKYGHIHTKLESISDEYEEGGKKYINVTLSCTRPTGTDTVCGNLLVLTKIQNYKKDDPDCSNKGSITYTTEDGQTKSIELPANGEHVLEGYEGTVRNYATLKYEDVTDSPIIYKASGAPATCGDEVDAVFQCKTCEKGVDVKISRQHVETNVRDVVEADCVTPGSYKFDCAYEGCGTHTGVIETTGHDFAFVDNTETTVTVKCSVEDCDYHTTAPTFDIKGSVVEERDMTCIDYKAGNFNYNAYTFIDTGDADLTEYTVKERIENDMHKLNGKPVKEKAEFVTGSKGIVELASDLATCQDKGAGYFQCEDCKLGVDVVIKGECVKPEGATIHEDELSCENDAYSYWYCAYGDRNNVEKIADKTGHKFQYTITAGVATVTCTNEHCDDDFDAFTVVLANIDEDDMDTVVTCDSTTTIYSVVYESEYTDGYTQEFEIKVSVAAEGHDWLLNEDGEKLICEYTEYAADGITVVRYGYGWYCTACNQYFIQAWDIPGARPWTSAN